MNIELFVVNYSDVDFNIDFNSILKENLYEIMFKSCFRKFDS